ncbi:MAG: CTP synthase [Parcubacteria group bacterium GW2011_GWB1_36_5]|nr:MAG: CTP synthase [Parcubacteria group bacterium GW2011_GWB1_36_5]
MKKKSTKYIFVVGGVMSGVGKGVASASISKILQSRGIEVTALKIDPYVNVDAGTMNPTEHGEVFVLDDGMECDQDMGNYERFLDRDLTRTNYMTTGSVYLSVIQKERNLEFGGKQVEVVPRIPLEIIKRINEAAEKAQAEVAVTEIGGTVGEYENILFLEAVRMLKIKNPHDVVLVLVSYVPALGAGGNELKTKPTQHAVREKIEFMCSLEKGDVISAPNVENIYEVPINFENDGLGDRIFKKLNISPSKKDMKEWRAMVAKMKNATKIIRIGIVGKYFGTGEFVLEDSYISVIESVKHASCVVGCRPEIVWLNSEQFEKPACQSAGGDLKSLKDLNKFDGIIVPGGFGSRGIEGKIAVAEYCRTHKIPYFGLCYGMQIATIEFARNVLGLKDAHTTEIDSTTKNPVIDVMPEQKKNLKEKNFGATMRLGAYPAILKNGSLASVAYGVSKISERHRHRYEVNPEYVEKLEKAGLVFSGTSPDGRLMEIAELPRTKHPFFLGTQFHPELKSRPLNPHPLFVAFIKACVSKKKK